MRKITKAAKRRQEERDMAGRVTRKSIEKERAMQRATAKAMNELKKIDFVTKARQMSDEHGFVSRAKTPREKDKCRAMLRREMTVLLLHYAKKARKLNTTETKALYLLERISEIELWLWDKRKSKFPVEQALKMYKAASQLEAKLSPMLPEKKRQIVERARTILKQEIARLKSIESNQEKKGVEVDDSLLSIAIKTAIRFANPLKEKSRLFVFIGSNMIRNAALRALLTRKL